MKPDELADYIAVKLLKLSYKGAKTHVRWPYIRYPICSNTGSDYWHEVEGQVPTCKHCQKILAKREIENEA